MTAATLTGSPLRERLQALISHTLYSVLTDAETAHGDDERAQLDSDRSTLDAAFGAVGAAGSDDEALAAYLTCCLELTGIPQAEWRVGILPATAAAGGTR